MPTISQAVAFTEQRQALNSGPLPAEKLPVSDTAFPTPQQDLAAGLGLPQRGIFAANLVLASDRSDNTRVFRGSVMRSPVFQTTSPVMISSTSKTSI